MAKKTPVKKSRRRLKRTVRRSLAAVLMITAIGVAAIPVPDSLADVGGGGGAAATPVLQYVDAETAVKNGDNVFETNKENTKNEYADIPADEVETDSTIKKAIQEGTLVATEIVIKEISGTFLQWQFLYKPIGNTSGVLCRYNAAKSVGKVDLSLQPIAHYYAITAKDYNNYFSFTDPSEVENLWKEMDNLDEYNGGNPVSGVLYPTTEIIYGYQQYNYSDDTINLPTEQLEFLNEYYPTDVPTYTARFREYHEKLKDAEENGGDAGEAPTALEVSPKTLRPTDKLKFFIEHNILLKGSGYELTEAYDNRLDGNGSLIYLAYGGDPEKLHPGIVETKYEDYEGYVVTKDTNSITAVGEKAFAGVENVTQIEISGQVQAIGDSAFEGSGIEKLHIGRADMIGNKAFAKCRTLTTVTFANNAGTKVIGDEAFRSSGISGTLELPQSIDTIGYGAFSDCQDLSVVQFDQTRKTGVDIQDYAFYDDTGLSEVNFGRIGVERMGKACFAIQSPGGEALDDFSFPAEGVNALGEYILGNRRGLLTVSIPSYSQSTPIPENTFYNCFGLEKAQFGDNSAYATFESQLFYYVTNPNFCVYGPAFCDGVNEAWPRQSTWEAERRDGVAIPYVYQIGDKTYYEVAYESEDGTRYRYGAGNNGELTDCALIPPISVSGLVDIVIPSQIGPYSINSIGSTCFSNQDLRKKIRSVTIQNNSISDIANGTFRDLPELKTVRIGNSVRVIGDYAFAGSKRLVDIYFATPLAGYESVSIGNNAFATTGSQLTLHGDIVKGYAPFDYAAEPTHTLKDPTDTSSTPALNVCYQSLWDSTNGTHLTVISDKDGNMTLVDYPKISDLSKENIEFDDELRNYCKDMENYYYYTVYDSGDSIEQLRREYALIWNAQNNKDPEVKINDGENGVIKSDKYDDALKERYGPWINPSYCGDKDEAGYWTSYLPTSGGESSGTSALVDILFKPIVAYAEGGNPTPYFTDSPYNFMENYERYLTDPNYDALPDYMRVTDQELKVYIRGTQDIVVPDGVDSIDVYTYSKECSDNYNTYIKNARSAESHAMYTSSTNGAHPGLFSGYYEDYDDKLADQDDDDNMPDEEGEEEVEDSKEKNKNGNDYIRSVVLTSVKTLPEYAFESCEQLQSVALGAIKDAGVLPFKDCPNLISLTGSDKCPAENGILYQALEDDPGAYKIVECLLSRGKSTVGNLGTTSIGLNPDSLISSVYEIADSAFEGCDGITAVDLQTANGLATIPEYCFKDCTSLNNVVVPINTTQIMNEAFSGITSEKTGGNHLTVTIYGREVDIDNDAFLPKNNITILSYEDSAARRYAQRYASDGMKSETLDAYRVMFFDYDGTQVGATQIVDKNASRGFYATEPPEAAELKEKDHRPGYTFDKWITSGGKTLDQEIEEDMTLFFAQYTQDGTMVNGKYTVEFLDMFGKRLSGRGALEDDIYYIEPGTSFKDNGFPEPRYEEYDGYKFRGWYYNSYNSTTGLMEPVEWKLDTSINSKMVILATYSVDAAGGSGGSSGVGGGGSSGTTQTTSNKSTSSSSTSSTSTTSTTSGSGTAVGKYTVTVENGSGSGSYDVGSTVIIAANTAPTGMVFQKWTTESNGVSLASVSMSATTFTMPANNVTVTANYIAGSGATAGTGSGNTGNTGSIGSTGGSRNNGTANNNGTRVDITKPGISNKDLATANVNGSTDNFVVKITETDEATRAVADALTNKYGSLENILYYAMDITLYDSTGTTKISDTTGLTVDITIPIPDALVAYGGNNMAGAVINSNQLENLNESFTTINGVPCIRFTATHFSPYTVYVDKGNLTEGMLDITPKTGDPIHPKWFLSIGLACLSIILFMKKDKKIKVKTA